MGDFGFFGDTTARTASSKASRNPFCVREELDVLPPMCFATRCPAFVDIARHFFVEEEEEAEREVTSPGDRMSSFEPAKMIGTPGQWS